MATVIDQEGLRAAIANMDAHIIVDADIYITSEVYIQYEVTISGGEGVSLFWQSPGAGRRYMIRLSEQGKLSLRDITLDAMGKDGTLVLIEGGQLDVYENTVFQNIVSVSSQNAIRMGAYNLPSGGVLNMYGGTIKNNKTANAVICYAGEIYMHNDAQIIDNTANGLAQSANSAGMRNKFTMTGNSAIKNNDSLNSPAGLILMFSDVLIGVEEQDAPQICDNKSSGYMIGGAYINTCDVKIFGNTTFARNFGSVGCGAIYFINSVAQIGGKTQFFENHADGACSAIGLETSTLDIIDDVKIYQNTCQEGTVLTTYGTTLNIGGNVQIHNNQANKAAGIQVAGGTLSLGKNNSAPHIFANTATQEGGGISIDPNGTVILCGNTLIEDNEAQFGKGIYKQGILQVSQSAKILDGLFFDKTLGARFSMEQNGFYLSQHLADGTCTQVLQNVMAQEQLSDPIYTANVPIISDALTEQAWFLLESSPYLSPQNVPLVIADKGEEYLELQENDRAAWHLPTEFAGYAPVLNDAKNQVLIDMQQFEIQFKNLEGTTQTNPTSFNLSDLPITLTAPSTRVGFAFTGWVDENGQKVQTIEQGTLHNLTLLATWERLYLHFDGNADCVCDIPMSIPLFADYALIPNIIPFRRCHRFVCWNIPNSGSGQCFFPNDIIYITQSSITLTAQWQKT